LTLDVTNPNSDLDLNFDPDLLTLYTANSDLLTFGVPNPNPDLDLNLDVDLLTLDVANPDKYIYFDLHFRRRGLLKCLQCR